MSENHIEARKDLERSIKARRRAIERTDVVLLESAWEMDDLKATKRTLIAKRDELIATLESLGGPLPYPDKKTKKPVKEA